MAVDDIADDRRRAEVFDALSHPTRILILKALNESNLGFADLKKKLGIESSGHLQHHLSKLEILIKTDEHGKYTLSDQGKDALLSVETVEKVAESRTKERKRLFDNPKRKFVYRIAIIALAFLLVASSSIAIFENSQASSLQNLIKEQDSTINNLSNQTKEQDSTINSLNNSLNLAQQTLTLNTVYINADGSVTGTNSIQRIEDHYVLTDNISGSIVVIKSNIVIDGAGYTLQGYGGTGIDLTSGDIYNVTVRNLRIMDFYFGIRTNGGGNHTFYNDYIGNTTNSVRLGITNGMRWGIVFWGSRSSNITYCTISGTSAITMELSSFNTITENNLSGGILLQLGGDETVDRNYWSDYLTKYPNATETDSTGIGNMPYVFNYSAGDVVGILQDNHPLMKPISIPIFPTP